MTSPCHPIQGTNKLEIDVILVTIVFQELQKVRPSENRVEIEKKIKLGDPHLPGEQRTSHGVGIGWV